jgi:hypothetical protein
MYQLQYQEAELCNHQISGSRINHLYHDLAESAKVFVPSGTFTLFPFLTLSLVDLNVQCLIKAGSAATDTSSLVFHLRETFVEGFRWYLKAISEHHLRVRTKSFNKAFAPSVSMEARELLQDLITEYNYLIVGVCEWTVTFSYL